MGKDPSSKQKKTGTHVTLHMALKAEYYCLAAGLLYKGREGLFPWNSGKQQQQLLGQLLLYWVCQIFMFGQEDRDHGIDGTQKPPIKWKLSPTNKTPEKHPTDLMQLDECRGAASISSPQLDPDRIRDRFSSKKGWLSSPYTKGVVYLFHIQKAPSHLEKKP